MTNLIELPARYELETSQFPCNAVMPCAIFFIHESYISDTSHQYKRSKVCLYSYM